MRPTPVTSLKGIVVFNRKSNIQASIDSLLERMEELPISSPEYTKAAEDLVKLTEALDKSSGAKSKLQAPMYALAGQAAVITALFAVEKNGVLTSKIPDYVTKIIKK